MMMRSKVFLPVLVLAILAAMIASAQNIPGKPGPAATSERRIMNAVQGPSYDTAVIRIDGKAYRGKKKDIAKVLDSAWESVYLPSREILIVSRFDTKATAEQKMAQATALEKALRTLLGAEMKSLIWGVSLQKGGDTLLFPAGRIYVLFDAKLGMADRKRLLAAYPDLEIRFLEDGKANMPVHDRSFVRGNVALPDYARTAAERGIELPSTVRPQKTGVIPKPFAVLRLPAGQEGRTFELADMIAGIKGVWIATPDFHALGKKLVTRLATNPPPIPASSSFIARAQIDRAWHLFYPMSYMGDAAFPGRFMCSDKLTAVLDGNFHDHASLRQLIIGYDALDNDHDPRTPIFPPDLTQADMYYMHGIYMSGVIGGHEQSAAYKCGVAPGTFIVPIREVAIENVDLSTREGTDQFVAEYADDWWNALFRLYVLSFDNQVTVANYSGTANDLIFDVTNMNAWLGWFLANGNWGEGIFFAASAGNTASSTTIAFPARHPSVFSVGWGDYQNDQVLGNHGPGIGVTVADGEWPAYVPPDAVYNDGSNSGGTSVSCAVVSGVATLMRVAGSTAVDTREQLSTILRLTTRFSDGMLPSVNSDGIHPLYGSGFLDAYHAVKVAYKDQMRPVGAAKIRFSMSEPSMVLINAAFPADAISFPGQPTGVFWSLKQETDGTGVYWKHARLNENSRHCDIIIDPLSPMGTFVVGDYDADGLDELVMQLGYWADRPEFYLIVQKFDQTTLRWRGMGSTTSSFPFVQYVLPQDYPVRHLFAARLMDMTQSDIVAVQGKALNVTRYDAAANLWKPLGTVNYAPALASAGVMSAIRGGWFSSYRSHLDRIEPFSSFQGKQTLLVLSRVEKKNWLFFWLKPVQHVIVSYLLYNTDTGSFENVPIDPSGETHRIVTTYKGTAKPFALVIDDFDGDGERETVMKVALSGPNLFLIDAVPGSQAAPPLSFLTTSVQPSTHPEVPLNARSGDIDGNKKAELTYITGSGNDNKVASLGWSAAAGDWTQSLPQLAHNRKNNRAKDLLVGDFNSDGIAEVGLLMEWPHGNIYVVYQMSGGQFREYGLW